MWEVFQFIFYAAATASESHRGWTPIFPWEKQRVWRTERIGYLSFAALTYRQEALKTEWRRDSIWASSQILSPSKRGHFLEPAHFLITHLPGVASQHNVCPRVWYGRNITALSLLMEEVNKELLLNLPAIHFHPFLPFLYFWLKMSIFYPNK